MCDNSVTCVTKCEIYIITSQKLALSTRYYQTKNIYTTIVSRTKNYTVMCSSCLAWKVSITPPIWDRKWRDRAGKWGEWRHVPYVRGVFRKWVWDYIRWRHVYVRAYVRERYKGMIYYLFLQCKDELSTWKACSVFNNK